MACCTLVKFTCALVFHHMWQNLQRNKTKCSNTQKTCERRKWKSSRLPHVGGLMWHTCREACWRAVRAPPPTTAIPRPYRNMSRLPIKTSYSQRLYANIVYESSRRRRPSSKLSRDAAQQQVSAQTESEQVTCEETATSARFKNTKVLLCPRSKVTWLFLSPKSLQQRFFLS